VGEAQGRVYYYKGASQVKVQANAIDATNLWYSRLGHPSSEVLNLLSSHLGVKQNNLDICDICFREKQTRTQFFISESKADGLFDLIHVTFGSL